MTALSPVAASVTNKSSGSITNGVAGESLTQGECVFLDSDSKWYAASAIGDGDLSGKSIGIVLAPADAADERAIVAANAGDEIDLGVAVTKGTWYVVGGADGILEEYGDLSSGENVSFVGYGNGTNLILQPHPTGFTK